MDYSELKSGETLIQTNAFLEGIGAILNRVALKFVIPDGFETVLIDTDAVMSIIVIAPPFPWLSCQDFEWIAHNVLTAGAVSDDPKLWTVRGFSDRYDVNRPCRSWSL